jgi:hypothetical protein
MPAAIPGGATPTTNARESGPFVRLACMPAKQEETTNDGAGDEDDDGEEHRALQQHGPATKL